MSNTTETKKPLTIEITNPERFEKLAATTMETTQRIAKRINKMFSTVFVDYYGSVVYCTAGNGNVGMNQQFMVELHFKPLALGSVENDGRKRAFKPVEEGKKSDDIVANLKSIYGAIRTSAKFELTDEGAQILSAYMLPGVDNGKNVDPWRSSSYDAVKAEYVDNQTFGQSPIMVRISGLDLIRLIRAIYGPKNEAGKDVQYGVIPYGPVTPNINNQMVQNAANWRVMIMQIDAEKTFDLASEFGIIPAGNGGSVVTGI